MLQGIVKFRARIVEAGKRLTVPLFDFNPNQPGVEKVEIEGPGGNEILTAVYLTSVTTEEAGISIATKVHMAAIDRISFYQDSAIENGHITETQFSSTDPPPAGQYRITPGTSYLNSWADAPTVALGLSDTAALKADLEQAAPPGERNFPLFRSALQSTSPVEKFMHLYNLLLMFFDDEQRGAQGRLDEFIRREEPGVALTPHPFWPKVDETLYTRLRNELAHNRKGVNLNDTKVKMEQYLSGLVSLTKRAIELHS